jgi:hypothetical protein
MITHVNFVIRNMHNTASATASRQFTTPRATASNQYKINITCRTFYRKCSTRSESMNFIIYAVSGIGCNRAASCFKLTASGPH